MGLFSPVKVILTQETIINSKAFKDKPTDKCNLLLESIIRRLKDFREDLKDHLQKVYKIESKSTK